MQYSLERSSPKTFCLFRLQPQRFANQRTLIFSFLHLYECLGNIQLQPVHQYIHNRIGQTVNILMCCFTTYICFFYSRVGLIQSIHTWCNNEPPPGQYEYSQRAFGGIHETILKCGWFIHISNRTTKDANTVLQGSFSSHSKCSLTLEHIGERWWGYWWTLYYLMLMFWI